MNDEAARQGRPATHSAEGHGSNAFGRKRPTPLQEATITLRDFVLDMRDELSDDVYSWWIGIGAEIFGTEAARLFVGEALRATRRAGGEWWEAA